MTRVRGLPRLSRTVIARPRLESLLDEALADQVTIVRAPTGYGKTSLVTRWLGSAETAGRHGVWIDLERVAPEADAFWSALDDRRRPAGALSAEPMLLVLDGYDQRWDSRLSAGLTRLIRRSPRLQLMILTRTITGFEAPAAAAGLDLCVITADDLALTRDELERASAALGLTAAKTTLDTIARVTGGWPLAARALFRIIEAERSEPAAGALDRALLAVSGELLDRLEVSPDELEALQRSAAAPYVTPAIVERLAPDAGGGDLISAVEAAGLGSWTHRHGRGRPVFEILEPIRRALLAGSEEAEPAARERLANCVAGALEFDGDALSALRHALGALDVALAELIVVRRLASVFGAEAREYFLTLRGIDQASITGSAVLLTVTGLLTEYHGDGSSAAMPYYVTAAELPLPRIRSSQAGQRSWIELAGMIALRKVGRLAEAEVQLSSIQTAEHAVPSFGWAEIGMTRLRLGSTEQAIACFRRAALMADHEHDRDSEVFALGSKAVAHAVRGEIDQAEEACARVDARARVDGGLTPQSLAPVRIARHLIATERGCADARDPRLDGLGDSHLGEFRPYAVFARALRAICRGERSGALDLLERELLCANTPPAGNVEHAPLVALRATLLIAERTISAAQHAISSFPDGTGALRTAAARLALMRRDFRSALTLADDVLAEELPPRDRVDALLIRGSAMKRAGDRVASGDAFEQAVRIAESHRLTTPFALAIGQDVRALLGAPGSRLPAAHELVPLLDESAMAAELTPREGVVLERLASSASLEVIAASLVVSVNTVKTQAGSVYRKLGASSRHDAVRIALAAGLLRGTHPSGRAPRAGGERVA
ncbi:LuxR C-terminal-related transcriptional regulator [Leifsonia sp. NPDC058248]|uniref:LuxR C-terminal-related transcriptional regulator n=1 Tax=Leifsonia sp. NPDC058248 TaxID=3346402 RepID=UPI0036DA95D1